jgi:hypothetical protein
MNIFKRILNWISNNTPELTIKPFIADKKMIESYCRIKHGKNKGKFDLVKYAELMQKCAEANRDIGNKI